MHQHFKLIERLRVWENVLLNREPKRGWAIDVAAARERVRALASTYGLAVDPDAVVETLPVGIKQRVELLRELDREPTVLLLDEPTAALAPSEIASFFTTIADLAKRGTAVLVVTHKLAEVIAYSQRVTVMRAGRVVASHLTGETSADAIAREMVGGEVPALAARASDDDRAAARGARAVRALGDERAGERDVRRCARARSSASRASKATGRPRSPTRSRASCRSPASWSTKARRCAPTTRPRRASRAASA